MDSTDGFTMIEDVCAESKCSYKYAAFALNALDFF